jgi:hypothetical protein
MRQIVEKEINDMAGDISSRLAGFASAVSKDREFAMKLLVENDPMAPEVLEVAGGYIEAMGFDILDLADSAYNILSCGHAPDRAGISDTGKALLTGGEPVCIVEEIEGAGVLAFEAHVRFKCADIPFHCFGGIVFDEELLSRLSPAAGVTVLLKRGEKVTGMDGVVTISAVADNRIVINEKTILASSFALPGTENDLESAEIIVIMEEKSK